MSDNWFTSKLDPEMENHPEEVLALKDYLRRKTTATEAAQTITRPVITSNSPKDDLACLQGLLHDALLELPAYTEQLLSLLQVIENLPEPNFTAVEPSQRPGEKLWKGLPHFANLWYEIGYRSGSWKMDAEKTSGTERDALRNEHVRRAEVEARLIMANLASIPIGWGYEVIEDALGKDALLDFEVPAAAEWLWVCGKRFRRGAVEGEKSYLQTQSDVVQQAATKALTAIHEVNREIQ
ncbi:hypothetical protein BKA58DRAFT_370966 [Alternaria rosae]|uniref:uncharacterized protein n=1 Tax=Alternaria rosae TaxID=1187941 RepID=UPI001E8CE6DF|nr:uncharacterized protein BKA58DRAFT_370966 [Alternaria rosae]KAH6851587.1 hypothetical protein BKA58DRAFT_370966 [Alternaria rosae]